MAKYIFVTGGVVSSLGKGITAASLGRLLKNRGIKVTIQKFDPQMGHLMHDVPRAQLLGHLPYRPHKEQHHIPHKVQGIQHLGSYVFEKASEHNQSPSIKY